MNAIDSRPLRRTSLVLPVVGIVLILTFVFDFVIRLFSLQWNKPEIQINFWNELIDRGVIPLIGLALVYAGFWLNGILSHQSETEDSPAPSPANNPQFWTFVFASLLGLVFLLLLPLHFSSSGEVVNAAITRTDQQEAQMKFGIQQEQQQIQQVIATPGQLDEILKTRKLPPEQLALFEELKKDPKALDKRAAQKLEEMKKQKQQVLNQVNQEVGQIRWRYEIRSLLLSLGFISIGWTGLRDAR
ncbi:MAG: hypothetical protein HC852_23150 [Acaryochloridaceae cyanobacterium RU_4_10]|jgi:hypothetical protein|nr:hypothetical protein [Acaryochloridaceae cyanobacterium RU_4_10]